MSQPRLGGVFAPVITPFTEDLRPDRERFVKHCQWLVSQGAGLAVFGTNSEANSLSVEEKRELLDSLVEAGVEPARMMPGTGSCALPDSVKLTRHALSLGCAGTLMLPPFYYKGVSDDGLFAYFAEVIESVASDSLRIYLYHIPPVSQVPLSLELIQRLAAAYPATIAGIKDSSGDWSHTRALNGLGLEDFRVFCGSESFLLRNMEAGGAGCISATANVNPAAIHALYRHWRDADAEQRQEGLNRIRDIFQHYPMIAALKGATAHYGEDPAWLRVRPPLTALDGARLRELSARLGAAGFDMPGLRRDTASG